MVVHLLSSTDTMDLAIKQITVVSRVYVSDNPGYILTWAQYLLSSGYLRYTIEWPHKQLHNKLLNAAITTYNHINSNDNKYIGISITITIFTTTTQTWLHVQKRHTSTFMMHNLHNMYVLLCIANFTPTPRQPTMVNNSPPQQILHCNISIEVIPWVPTSVLIVANLTTLGTPLSL